MIAARIPAVTNPTMIGFSTRKRSVRLRTAPTLESGRPFMIPTAAAGHASLGVALKTPVAQRPMRTQGTQTIAIQMGWAITVSLNDFALFAVSQCWKRCGNMPTESGMNM